MPISTWRGEDTRSIEYRLLLLGRIAVGLLCVRICGILLQTEKHGLSVCRSVTIVSPAKTAEPIEMPFGLWTPVGPRRRELDGVQIP